MFFVVILPSSSLSEALERNPLSLKLELSSDNESLLDAESSLILFVMLAIAGFCSSWVWCIFWGAFLGEQWELGGGHGLY